MKITNILRAHEESTGGFISGEIKLALTLLLLAGGSYLDLALLFEMGFTYSYVVFHDVIGGWITDDGFVKINRAEYFSDVDWMSTRRSSDLRYVANTMVCHVAKIGRASCR